MSDQTTAVIDTVTSKEGATNGKAWRKYSVKTEDGTFYSTFDKAIAEKAHGLLGKRALITWKASGSEGQFKDVVNVDEASGVAAASDVLPAARSAGGTPDWDEIGLRKTRCLLWAEFIGSPLAASLEQDFDKIYRFGTALIEMAERDIYWRAPATESSDLPFS